MWEGVWGGVVCERVYGEGGCMWEGEWGGLCVGGCMGWSFTSLGVRDWLCMEGCNSSISKKCVF